MPFHEYDQRKLDAHTATSLSSRGGVILIRISAVRLEAQAITTNRISPNRTHQSVMRDSPITMHKDKNHHNRRLHSYHNRRAIRTECCQPNQSPCAKTTTTNLECAIPIMIDVQYALLADDLICQCSAPKHT